MSLTTASLSRRNFIIVHLTLEKLITKTTLFLVCTFALLISPSVFAWPSDDCYVLGNVDPNLIIPRSDLIKYCNEHPGALVVVAEIDNNENFSGPWSQDEDILGDALGI